MINKISEISNLIEEMTNFEIDDVITIEKLREITKLASIAHGLLYEIEQEVK